MVNPGCEGKRAHSAGRIGCGISGTNLFLICLLLRTRNTRTCVNAKVERGS